MDRGIFLRATYVVGEQLRRPATWLRFTLFVVLYTAAVGLPAAAALRLGLGATTGAEEGARSALGPLAVFLGGSMQAAIERGTIPLVGWLALAVSSVAVPGLVMLVGYDAIVEDRRTGFLRYVFQRVERKAYLAGKFATLFSIGFFGVLVGNLALIAIAATTSAVEPARYLAALPHTWLPIALLVASHAALVLVVSAWAASSFIALAAGSIGLFLVSVASWISSPFARVWLSRHSLTLFALDGTSVVVHVVWAILFIVLAAWLLERKDA